MNTVLEPPAAPTPARDGQSRAPLRVLATLNEDGSRRYVRPKPSAGRWHAWRRVVAYLLMVVFWALPHLRINDKPVVLLDLLRREFTILGTTFYATDTVLFQLLFLSGFIGIFFFTALLGRVWCGWACPQTVYLEFLFRPIEYLFEGGRTGTLTIDRSGRLNPRRIAKWGVYLLLAATLAHTFLAYFVGTEELARWMRRSPTEHWTSFVIMAGVTGVLFFNFTWFREQTCMVVCPYGRIQSVLLDRHSLIVAYDPARGEPRGKPARQESGVARGDCVDCTACVQTCPTGIDIRNGLQMECVHCTQCIDACDSIMDRVGKSRGLIRYTSRAALDGEPLRWLRPRTMLYPVALTLTLGTFAWLVGTRESAELTILRGRGEPFTVDAATGVVMNQLRIKVRNTGNADRAYTLSLVNAPQAGMIAPINPMPVGRGDLGEQVVFVTLPGTAFEHGVRKVRLRITDGATFTEERTYRLLGPGHGNEREERDDDDR